MTNFLNFKSCILIESFRLSLFLCFLNLLAAFATTATDLNFFFPNLRGISSQKTRLQMGISSMIRIKHWHIRKMMAVVPMILEFLASTVSLKRGSVMLADRAEKTGVHFSNSQIVTINMYCASQKNMY